MSRLRCFVLSLLLVFVSSLVVAQEVPVVPADDTPIMVEAVEAAAAAPAVDQPVAEVVDESVEDPADLPVWWGHLDFWKILAGAVVFIWGLVKAKYGLDKKWGDQVIEFLEVGAQVAYDTFVRDAKAKAANHKLSAAQIEEARKTAWDAAKAYARTKGVDLAKKVAVERLPVLFTKVVTKLKQRNK